MYRLQYWMPSDLIDMRVSFEHSDDMDVLMDMIGTRNDNGELWILHVFINGIAYTVGEATEYRETLTQKINKVVAYKLKGIDKERDKFIKKYDEKGLKPTK